jgi:hypothetical protein
LRRLQAKFLRSECRGWVKPSKYDRSCTVTGYRASLWALISQMTEEEG